MEFYLFMDQTLSMVKTIMAFKMQFMISVISSA